MSLITISDKEFASIQRFILDAAGISLSDAKKPLVCGRLGKRLHHYSLGSYAEYYSMLSSGKAPGEVQVAIDLLTTNETHFFREPKHFDLLRRLAEGAKGRSEIFRVWSAASSTGEEAYSIAMVLDDCLGSTPWEVVGSDISTRVLERARAGHYACTRTEQIPRPYLQRYCLKGHGPQAGTLLVQRGLRERVRFRQVNLNESLPQLGPFDVIFLRNVMIYFNMETKRQVVARLLAQLKPRGYFLVSHSETLNEINDDVVAVAPSVYRKQ